MRQELPRRKDELKVQFFDDLLTRLHSALAGTGGPALAALLRRQYAAALIDEFQDTDPLQYEIFSRVFTGPENYLFLIGDPKQAIYGFRGADIFTYLKASQHSDQAYTLKENWRSEVGPGPLGQRRLRRSGPALRVPRHPIPSRGSQR